MKRILLFKIGALGDLLMTTPLVRQLRKRFPGARIDYLAGKSFVRVLAGNPNIDRVIDFPEEIFLRRNIPGFFRLAWTIRKEGYDAVFVLDRHWIFPAAAFLSGARRRIGLDRMGREGILLTDRVRFEAVRHEVHYYLDLLDRVAVADRGDVAMDFFTSRDEEAFAERFFADRGLSGRRVVCLAPGGGVNPGQEMELKRWPADRWVALVRLLTATGHAVLLVGGATDRDVEKEILAAVDVPSAVGVGLGESAALLARADAVVCNDSGPMHLAAAVNRRVVSLFGPTDPRRLAPLAGGTFLWKPGTCGPCYDIYGRFPACKRDHECMKAITPDEVFRAVSAIAAADESMKRGAPGEDR